jgi:hypothetical protein
VLHTDANCIPLSLPQVYLTIYLCVLGPFQWSHEVKVGEICASKLGSSRRYDTVQKYFDEQQVGCWGTYIFWIVDEVPSHCGSGSMWILLLSLDVAYKLVEVTSFSLSDRLKDVVV